MAAELGGCCSLVSCQEAYAKSLNSFIASLDSKKGNLTLKCLEGHEVPLLRDLLRGVCVGGGGGGTLGISGWGRAAGTLEPLTYTRASSAK